MRHSSLTLLLLSVVALALVRPGPSPARADDPKAKPGKDEKPGKDGKPDDPPKPDEDEADDFFEGETTFSPEQVKKAIERGVNWLRKRQTGDGDWGEISGGKLYGGGEGKGYGHPAGCTALSLYTLLKCGLSPRDPTITKGFKHLQGSDELYKPGGSYETSVLLLAVAATADQAKTLKASDKKMSQQKATLSGPMRKWAQDLVDHLLTKRQTRAWRYNHPKGVTPPGGNEDLSSTQLATLGLFYAHRLGIRVKDQVWEDIMSYALDQQDETGEDVAWAGEKAPWQSRGFAYIKGQPDASEGKATGGMTACGVAILMMSRFALSDGGKKQALWDARPDKDKVQKAVNDGLAWLDKNYSPFNNPHKTEGNIYHMYYLYAFERMMDLAFGTGKQLLNKHMWYSDMGQQILDRQAEDGSWKTGTTLEPGEVQDTCFALLFLKRATKGTIPFPSLTGGSEDPPADNR